MGCFFVCGVNICYHKGSFGSVFDQFFINLDKSCPARAVAGLCLPRFVQNSLLQTRGEAEEFIFAPLMFFHPL